MGQLRRTRGFSLVEVLVVVAIVAILMSMAYSALYKGKTVSKETACLNNLKQIAVGLNLYYNRHGVYPPEALGSCLGEYVGDNPNLFICPSDEDPKGDSYSSFYVARGEQSSQGYVCGCPRHADESSTITLFSSTTTHVLRTSKTLWNGQPVGPGTSVGTGVLSFEDGSKVTIPSGMMIRLIQSFHRHDGRCYSLIGVGINEQGVLDIEVTPGSRFEVVTPAAIAGVQGTRFKLTAAIQGDLYCVQLDVSEGQVTMEPLSSTAPAKPIKAGQSTKVNMARVDVVKALPRGWLRRRVVLNDDAAVQAQATAPGQTGNANNDWGNP